MIKMHFSRWFIVLFLLNAAFVFAGGFRSVDLSTGANSENLPEINNRVNIAGPAQVRIAPVVGATLLITYKKEPNEGGGEETTATRC
jgi:hypothetical protein